MDTLQLVDPPWKVLMMELSLSENGRKQVRWLVLWVFEFGLRVAVVAKEAEEKTRMREEKGCLSPQYSMRTRTGERSEGLDCELVDRD